jgi:hypothetical protein
MDLLSGVLNFTNCFNQFLFSGSPNMMQVRFEDFMITGADGAL